MPIVFVHGVNNRDDAAYRENELARNGFLREIVAPALGMAAGEIEILSPYWGQFGAQFAWGMAVLPDRTKAVEAFGEDAEAEARRQVAGLLADCGMDGDIVALARANLGAAVDLLYATAMLGTTTEDDARSLASSYSQAADYAAANPSPSWIDSATAENFADQLIYASRRTDVESFGSDGVLDWLKESIQRLAAAAARATTAPIGRFVRAKFGATLTRFVGDVCAYLTYRGSVEQPGPIVTTVLKALRQASELNRATGEKLVVIAHSFGGAIIYDVLTYFAPELQVDCLVTVGSQVGLFEEMKLYKASHPDLPPNPPGGRVGHPPNVKRWLNVFDCNDVLSYRLAPVVEGAADFHYDTGAGVINAHGGYFTRPGFYQRLAERLKQP